MNINDYWDDYRAASDANCSPDTLTHLARYSPNPRAREAAVAHPQCPGSVLAAAAQDADPGVRMAAAQRTDLPYNLRLRLVADPDPLVHAVAIQHPDVPIPTVMASSA